MSDEVFWLAGNVLLPLTPIVFSALALKAVSRTVNAHAVLGDGVLYFYSATLAAVFVFDLTQRLISGPQPLGLATALSMIGALRLLLASSGGYALAVIGHGGAKDFYGEPRKLTWLTRTSWKSALGGASLILAVRVWLRLF